MRNTCLPDCPVVGLSSYIVGFVNIRVKDTVSAASPNPADEKEKTLEDFQAVSFCKNGGIDSTVLYPVLRIRIHRIHMFLGLLDLDPDPLVRGMDPDPGPDPSIIKQK